jgi:hypothetical protein
MDDSILIAAKPIIHLSFFGSVWSGMAEGTFGNVTTRNIDIDVSYNPPNKHLGLQTQ